MPGKGWSCILDTALAFAGHGDASSLYMAAAVSAILGMSPGTRAAVRAALATADDA
jgi:hypothetical protein